MVKKSIRKLKTKKELMINIKVILSLLLLFPSTVYSDSWKEWLKEDLYEDQFLEDQTEDIIIDAPYHSLDGGNVPITITTKSKDIVKLTLIIDENPTPCCNYI